MSMLDRLTDVKKSTYAKIIAVLVSIAMVLSLTNMSAFAEGDGLAALFGGNASDTVEVAVDLDNTKIEYGDQTITDTTATFKAPAGKDLKFKASAVTEDFTLDEVALVTTANNGDEVVTDLEPVEGMYSVQATDVAEGIVLRASATEQVNGNDTTDTADAANTDTTGTTGANTTITDETNVDNATGTTNEPAVNEPAAGDQTGDEATGTETTTPGTTETGTDNGTVEQPTQETVITANVANTVKTSVNAFAKAFTANTGIETLAAEPMADSTYTVKVGNTINLYGSRGNDHKWSSNNANIATVDENWSSATVKGVSPGTVTIVHTYKRWGYTYTETFVVTVTEHVEDAYFYFVLPGKSSTSTSPNDYMYAGKGEVSIPSNFNYNDSKTRWSNGSNQNNAPFVVEDYVTKLPSDQAIRQGLKAHYGSEYNDNWTYEISYLNLVGKSASTGYDRKELNPSERCHVDLAITINRNDQVAFNYSIQMPDGSVVSNSTMHKKSSSDTVEVNSTVDNTRRFSTDGYSYNGVIDGKFTFDGWYTDPSYQTKADDSVVPNEQRTFYAHYITHPRTVTYDTAGGKFKDGATTTSARHDVGSVVKIRTDEPTRDGYIFAGWKSDGSGEIYKAGRSVIMPDRDVTLTAQWNPISHTLATTNDENSSFTEPAENNYLHSETDNFVVKFKAADGYVIDSVTVDGKALSGDELANAVKDGVTLDQKTNHSVAITSKQLVSYTVKYLDEVTKRPVADEKSVSNVMSGTPISVDAVDVKNYVLVGDKTQTGTATNDAIFTFYYAKDTVEDPSEDKNGNDPGDGIPDKYQITIKFVSSDNAKGTLEGTTSYVVTLKDGDGNYVEKGTHTPNAKDVDLKPTTGYEFEEWTPELKTREVVGGNEYKYSANWKLSQYKWSVNFKFDGKPVTDYVPSDFGTQPVSGTEGYNKEVSYKPLGAVDYNKHHYVLVSSKAETVVISDDETENVMTVQYELDELGGTPESPGDTTPDKYQKVITFVVNNGSWGTTDNSTKENETKVVTLTKAEEVDGETNYVPAVDGTYTLVATDIPEYGFVPDAGYKVGSWDVDPVDQVVNDNRTFTYTYAPDNGQTHNVAYRVEYYAGNEYQKDLTHSKYGESTWVQTPATVSVNAKEIKLENAIPGYVINYDKTVSSNNLTINESTNGQIEQLREALSKLVFTNDDPNTKNVLKTIRIYYKAAPATINFVTNAAGITVDPLTGVTDQAIANTDMPTPTRTGYKLVGWYDNQQLAGNPVSVLPDTFPAGETTYYAKWAADFSQTAITASNIDEIYSGNGYSSTISTGVEGDSYYIVDENGNRVDNNFVNVSQSGTYSVYITRAGATSDPVTFVVDIDPVALNILADSFQKHYGDNDPAFTGAVEGFVNNETTAVLGENAITYSRAAGEDVGNYAITPVINLNNENYMVGTVTSGNLEIVASDQNAVEAQGFVKQYNAESSSITVNAAENSTFHFSLDGVNYSEEMPAFENVGTYTVYVYATNPNYEQTSTVRVTSVITPAPVTVTVNDASKVAATSDPEFAATVEGLFNEDAIDYTIARPGAGTDEAVGTYENALVATGESAQGNYVVTFVPGSFTITAPAPANPGNPGGGTPATVPGPVPGVAPADGPAAALAPVAAALAAPVAALIGDEPTPLAEETIGDEEDPLAAFDHVNCWVHYYMILGILLTLVYGGCVIARRSNYSRKIQKMDDYATGKAMDTVEETENVANTAAQKMEA